ncbi:MAG TPA: TIM barrel protein [Spirochaetia bacterium]|nr:TIM barrel protein [Spirochaetia bacterium]
MKPSICIEMLYDGLSAEDKIRRISDAGFVSIEFWGWRDKDLEAVRRACAQNGVSVSNFSGQRSGDLVNPTTHGSLLEDYRDSLEAAKLLSTKHLMVLTNELGAGGMVVNSYSEIPDQEKLESVVDGLESIVKMTPADMQVLLEPLNTTVDHAGYFLSDLGTASEIVKRVDDPRLRLLCDLYHQGMMGDDPIRLIEEYSDVIGYYHVADYPGRHEPGTGGADWQAILSSIAHSGYTGYVGFEYAPIAGSEASLAAIANLWDSLG